MSTPSRFLGSLLALAACGSPVEEPPTWAFPAPEDGPGLLGPGGPAVAFDQEELFTNCSVLPGGPNDINHHNLVVPYRGHLVMPWAPEWGNGGISLFDVSDPCDPVKVGEGTSSSMRETHAMGFAMIPSGPNAGEWAVVNMMGGIEASGIQFWDLTDLEAPMAVADLSLPDVYYPDSYARISLSVFWQYPYVYVAAADIGVYIVDATDPRAPTVAGHYTFPTGLRAGSVFAMGSLLMVTAAEQSETVLLDISSPTEPQPIPGGTWLVTDSTGEPRDYYFGNIAGNYALFARKENGAGPIVYDISDPTSPTFLADLPLPGGGGYIFYDEGYLFTGDSSAAHVVDARDWDDLELVGTGLLPGDLDTMTPYGNVAMLSVDDEAEDGEATVAMPWTEQPDDDGPEVLRVDPPDGATGISTSVRIGVGFNEMVEPGTVFEGSIRLYQGDEPVRGWTSTQETIASYAPRQPLLPGTTYRVEVMAGGVSDINGNTVASTTSTTFTTAN